MPEILISTVLMGVLLITVFVAINRSGQRATPSGQSSGRSGFAEWSGRGDHENRLAEFAYSPLTWTVSFVLLTIVFLAGAVLLAQGVPDELSTGMIQNAILGLGGAVLGGYIFFGSYVATRDRSGSTAAGVAVASTVVGTLMLVGVVVVLIWG